MKKLLSVLVMSLAMLGSIYAQPRLKSVNEVTEYKLSYELNGGENAASNKEKYAENSVVKLGIPTKSGYDFKGWYWDEDFTSIVTDNTFSGKTQALKVYAKWEMQSVSLDNYASNMVTIIPAGNKVELENFAGTEGIQIINAYEISKYEVTQGVYKTVMGENPSRFDGTDRPVENVSWYDAIYFCNKFSQMSGLEPVYTVNGNTDVTKWNYTPHKGNYISGEIQQDTSKNGYRLPTEAEWEMAARGGVAGGWDYTYSGSNNIGEVAWYGRNSGNETHKVGQKKANTAGLYDMSGNVWEWCWDCYYDSRYNRGGNYHSSDYHCKVSYSGSNDAYYSYDSLGFRLVRTSK